MVADPLEETLTTLFAFAASSCPLPRGAGVHGLLRCDESTVLLAVLPSRFVLVPAFETDIYFLPFSFKMGPFLSSGLEFSHQIVTSKRR